MNRGKITAIITGAISILLAVGYLVLVEILDSRGPMVPAPMTEDIDLAPDRSVSLGFGEPFTPTPRRSPTIEG